MRHFAVDLFCGAGGVSCGLIQAKYTVIAGIDIEKKCEKIYLQNKNADGTTPVFFNFDIFPSTSNYPGGQQHLAIQEIKKVLKKYNFSRKQNDTLLLAICAPCQPFTKITKINLSNKIKFKRERDKNLLLTTLQIIEKLKPDAILCENVEGIDSAILSKFKAQLNDLNFSFEANVINAAKFGVPQNRRRTIGIGYNCRYIASHPIVPIEDKECHQEVGVRAAIGNLPRLIAGEKHKTIANHVARALSDLNLKRISSAKPGESNKYLKNTPYGDLSLACHQRMIKPSFSDTYTRMHPERASPTITTKFLSITNGRFGHFDTSQNRGLSLKEGALLQTFPDDYEFHIEYGTGFLATLIGNAVPPKLARFFGNHIIDNGLTKRSSGQQKKAPESLALETPA